MSERLRFSLWAAAALAACLLLRLWFLAHLSRVAGDSLVYGDIAKNLLLHGVYGFTEAGPTPGSTVIRPTLIRLPGYPFFLAACFRLFGVEHYGAAMYVQAFADLGTCVLASALAGRLFGSRARLAVLWLAALCPFTATYVALPLTETLVLFCIALVFYAFARWQEAGLGFNRWLWVIVFALAYGILLRPEQGLMAAAVMPAMLWASLRTPQQRNVIVRSAWPVAAAALCVLLPLAPWAARNWRTFHVFQPLAPRSAADPGETDPVGFQRWYRTWAIDFASTASIYWNYDGNPIQLDSLPPRAVAAGCIAHGSAASGPLYARTAALFDDYNQASASTPAIDARFAQLAADRIHADPLCYYLALPAARVLNMLLRPRIETMPIPDEWWRWSLHRGQTAFAAAYGALNLLYLALAFAGLLLWGRLSRDGTTWAGTPELAWAMLGCVVLRLALLLTLDNSEPRYTLELFPVLFVWAGALFAQRRNSPRK